GSLVVAPVIVPVQLPAKFVAINASVIKQNISASVRNNDHYIVCRLLLQKNLYGWEASPVAKARGCKGRPYFTSLTVNCRYFFAAFFASDGQFSSTLMSPSRAEDGATRIRPFFRSRSKLCAVA